MSPGAIQASGGAWEHDHLLANLPEALSAASNPPKYLLQKQAHFLQTQSHRSSEFQD